MFTSFTDINLVEQNQQFCSRKEVKTKPAQISSSQQRQITRKTLTKRYASKIIGRHCQGEKKHCGGQSFSSATWYFAWEPMNQQGILKYVFVLEYI